MGIWYDCNVFTELPFMSKSAYSMLFVGNLLGFLKLHSNEVIVLWIQSLHSWSVVHHCSIQHDVLPRQSMRVFWNLNVGALSLSSFRLITEFSLNPVSASSVLKSWYGFWFDMVELALVKKKKVKQQELVFWIMLWPYSVVLCDYVIWNRWSGQISSYFINCKTIIAFIFLIEIENPETVQWPFNLLITSRRHTIVPYDQGIIRLCLHFWLAS